VGAAAVEVVEAQQEFLAAPARYPVATPQVLGQHVGDVFQCLVADVMAVLVVDQLEAVDVDDGEGESAGVAARPVPFHFYAVFRRAAVGQSGQVVFQCDAHDRLFRRLAFGDVVFQCDEVRDFAAVVGDRDDGDVRPVAQPFLGVIEDFDMHAAPGGKRLAHGDAGGLAGFRAL